MRTVLIAFAVLTSLPHGTLAKEVITYECNQDQHVTNVDSTSTLNTGTGYCTRPGYPCCLPLEPLTLCTSDADCGGCRNGACVLSSRSCVTDQDCAPDSVCAVGHGSTARTIIGGLSCAEGVKVLFANHYKLLFIVPRPAASTGAGNVVYMFEQ